MSDLEIDGLDRWFPLDLDADPADYAERLELQFPDTPGIDLVAPGVAGLAGNIARGGAATADEAMLLGAWLLSESSDRLEPVVTATLRGVRLAGTPSPAEFARELLEGQEIYGTPELDPVATPSGPAHLQTVRSVHHSDGEREVHESSTVFWLRPDDGFAVTLTAHSADLLSARDVPDALRQLAEGVRGL